MLHTYEGILRGDRIDWIKDRPAPANPVRVHVTIIEAAPQASRRGERMAAALSALAERGGLTMEGEASQWQREVRQERKLPGREG